MSSIYNVTIKTTDKESLFCITWHHAGTSTMNSFGQKVNITPEETHRLWRHPL